MTSYHENRFYADIEVSMQEKRDAEKQCTNCGEPHINEGKFCCPSCQSEFYD